MNYTAANFVSNVTMAAPSAMVMFVLLVLLGLSAGMYWLLVWRETSARRSVALAEWSRASGFYTNPLARLRPPAPLDKFGPHLRIRTCLVSPKASVVDFSVDRLPGTTEEPTDLNAAPKLPPRFHALIWTVDADWPAVALRPAHAVISMVDALDLPSQSARYGTQRFAVHSQNRHIAGVVAGSRLRGLLPADIGLLLMGRTLVIDFSGRPFDGIEFNRMIAIAEQVLAHLPSTA